MFKVTHDEIDNICRKFNAPTFSEYLEFSGELYAIATFDKLVQKITSMDGVADPVLIEFIKNETGLNEWIFAGYQQYSNILEKPINVFVFQEALLESDDVELRELLILHEFCHLLDLQGYFKKKNLELSEKEENVGWALSKIANYISEMTSAFGGDDFYHNATFGGILAHFIIAFYPNNWAAKLDKAMCKNFPKREPEVYQAAYDAA
jgi:hypothetical protein